MADAALFLDAMGPVGEGELWRSFPWEPGAHTRALSQPVPFLHIGVLTDPTIDVVVDRECLRAVDLTRQALLDLGHRVDDIAVDSVPRFGDLEESILLNVICRTTRGALSIVPEDRRHLLMPFTRWLMAKSVNVTAVDLVSAQTQIALATSAWLRVLSRYDVVLTPTTTAPPLPTGGLRFDDGLASGQAMLRWSAFTPWANFSGAPAISLPVHRSPAGVPIASMISALPGQDELLLSLSAQLEGVFAWQEVHPPQFTA